MTRIVLAFRRRCGWCGVQLRAWQVNLCRACRTVAYGDAGLYLRSGGPTYHEAGRWEAEPDRWQWHPAAVAVWRFLRRCRAILNDMAR